MINEHSERFGNLSCCWPGFFINCILVIQEGKVLIVIGGDDLYGDKDEEESAVISRWARRKVASQFKEECLDGRESFIFSWNRQHREIHEEALLHFFDPSKKRRRFEYQPKPKRETPKIPSKEVLECCCLFAIVLEKYGFRNFKTYPRPLPLTKQTNH